MKKIILLTIILFAISCGRNDERLENEIAELKAKNTKLEEDLKNSKAQEIINLQLQLDSKTKIKFDGENKIYGSFIRYEKIPEYNLYIVDSLRNQKSLIAKNLVEPNFNFNFKPKSENDTLLRVIAEIKTKDQTIEIFGRLDFKK